MSEGATVEQEPVSFSLENGTLTLHDMVGGGKVDFETEGETWLTPASKSWFDVPMDGAVSLEVASVRSDNVTAAAVRDHDGEHYGNVTAQPFTLDADAAFLELFGSLKTIIYVEEGTVTGYLEDAGNDEMAGVVFEFDEPTRVIVGARSYHEVPAATMTVPDDPEALMTAASYLGSGIKEWSAERSWPTLRGHPPAIEFGDELHIPDRLSKPETGVTVAVPADTASVLRVTPLAHYLGAEVVPGNRPELRFEGHVESLGRGQALEASVDELLARCTLLDSLVRIGGYYANPRIEYDELAPELPFYPPELYDEPLVQQLREYLEVPFDVLEPFVPRWPAETTLRPTMADAEAVPYLLNSLVRVHVTSDGRPRTPDESAPVDSPIQLSTASTVAPGVASVPAAGRRRMASRERAPGGAASVLFIDSRRSGGDLFERVNWSQFDIGEGTPTVERRRAVTCRALRTALQSDDLYVHFGNRVTPEGFVCSDGVLGFDELPDGDVGGISFQWNHEETSPLSGVFDAASVACLTPERLTPKAVERFGVALVLGYSVAVSTQLAGFAGRVRYLGDASLALAERPCGHPPVIFTVEDAVTDGYCVSASLEIPVEDPIGRTMVLYPQECHDEHQLGNTRTTLAEPVAVDRLVELCENGGVARFERDVADEDGMGALHDSGVAFGRQSRFIS